ncbi:MAG: hypothetical protein QCI38_08815, partial [Candidatus Thermoplasmatota archaeon]|nr:hypothetical protein [Candidatus Thermoplasmatota archaeon]
MPLFQLETALFISLLGAMFYYFGKVIDETTPKQSEDFHLYVMGVFFVAGYILLPTIIWFEFLKEQTWFLWPLFNPIVTIAIQFIIGTGILVYVMMKYRAKTHITRSSDKDKVVAGLSSFLLSFLFVTPILASLVSNQIFSLAFYMVMGFFG